MEDPENYDSYLPRWFIDKIGKIIRISKSNTTFSYFSFAENMLYLSERWMHFERTSKMLASTIVHEFGHAYHYNTNLINDEKVATEIRKFYKNGRELLTQLTDNQLDLLNSKLVAQNIAKLQEIYEGGCSFAELYRYLAVVGDLFASLTGGELGFGHPQNYWQDSIRKFQEYFANSTDIFMNENPILMDYFPEFVTLIKTFWNNEKERTTKI